MRVMTSQQERILARLNRLAGDPSLVERALRDTNAQSDTPPTIRDVIWRILELRRERAELAERESQWRELAGTR